MTALDDRIRALAPPAEQQPTPVEELRRRGARRRARQRVVAGVAALAVVAVVVGLALVRPSGPDPDTVVAEPPPQELEPVSEQITFGGAEGVTLTVSPSTGLVDGQSVEVRVEGLDRLPGAQLAMCRGDLQEPVGLEQCDASVFGFPKAAEADQMVVVSAALRLSGRGTPYDCAAEPAGCILAVGVTGPRVRGVAVPLEFVPGTAEQVGDEVMSIEPATGLVDGQSIQVSATGLAPNRLYWLSTCAVATDDGSICSSVDPASVSGIADSTGSLSAEVVVGSVVWSLQDGVVDCTVRGCRVQVLTDAFSPAAVSAPIAFAPGVVAPIPRLVLDPAGPYVDGQEVLVRGSGFVPGTTVGGHLAQCPAGLDTRKEERCTYGAGFGDVVSGDGTFAVSVPVQESLLYTGSCREGSGCLVGWVISKGPTVAAVPITFR
jgi:hypothetical protein